MAGNSLFVPKGSSLAHPAFRLLADYGSDSDNTTNGSRQIEIDDKGNRQGVDIENEIYKAPSAEAKCAEEASVLSETEIQFFRAEEAQHDSEDRDQQKEAILQENMEPSLEQKASCILENGTEEDSGARDPPSHRKTERRIETISTNDTTRRRARRAVGKGNGSPVDYPPVHFTRGTRRRTLQSIASTESNSCKQLVPKAMEEAVLSSTGLGSLQSLRTVDEDWIRIVYQLRDCRSYDAPLLMRAVKEALTTTLDQDVILRLQLALHPNLFKMTSCILARTYLLLVLQHRTETSNLVSQTAVGLWKVFQESSSFPVALYQVPEVISEVTYRSLLFLRVLNPGPRCITLLDTGSRRRADLLEDGTIACEDYYFSSPADFASHFLDVELSTSDPHSGWDLVCYRGKPLLQYKGEQVAGQAAKAPERVKEERPPTSAANNARDLHPKGGVTDEKPESAACVSTNGKVRKAKAQARIRKRRDSKKDGVKADLASHQRGDRTETATSVSVVPADRLAMKAAASKLQNSTAVATREVPGVIKKDEGKSRKRPRTPKSGPKRVPSKPAAHDTSLRAESEPATGGSSLKTSPRPPKLKVETLRAWDEKTKVTSPRSPALLPKMIGTHFDGGALVWDHSHFTDQSDDEASNKFSIDGNSVISARTEYSTTKLRTQASRRDSSVRHSQLKMGLARGFLDPHTLVKCEKYLSPAALDFHSPTEQLRQPFRVSINPAAAFLCDLHAHLADIEIIGFLGGKYDAETRRVYIQAAFPCRSLKSHLHDGSTDVEMDPSSEIEVREIIDQRGMQVVGWYHSHPAFEPNPSVMDIHNQSNYQNLFLHAATGVMPFVGLIVGTYDQKNPTAQSVCRYFHVRYEKTSRSEEMVPCPMLLTTGIRKHRKAASKLCFGGHMYADVYRALRYRPATKTGRKPKTHISTAQKFGTDLQGVKNSTCEQEIVASPGWKVLDSREGTISRISDTQEEGQSQALPDLRAEVLPKQIGASVQMNGDQAADNVPTGEDGPAVRQDPSVSPTGGTSKETRLSQPSNNIDATIEKDAKVVSNSVYSGEHQRCEVKTSEDLERSTMERGTREGEQSLREQSPEKPAKGSADRRWSASERALLSHGIRLYGHLWQPVSAYVFTRTSSQCMQQYFHFKKQFDAGDYDVSEGELAALETQRPTSAEAIGKPKLLSKKRSAFLAKGNRGKRKRKKNGSGRNRHSEREDMTDDDDGADGYAQYSELEDLESSEKASSRGEGETHLSTGKSKGSSLCAIVDGKTFRVEVLCDGVRVIPDKQNGGDAAKESSMLLQESRCALFAHGEEVQGLVHQAVHVIDYYKRFGKRINLNEPWRSNITKLEKLTQSLHFWVQYLPLDCTQQEPFLQMAERGQLGKWDCSRIRMCSLPSQHNLTCSEFFHVHQSHELACHRTLLRTLGSAGNGDSGALSEGRQGRNRSLIGRHQSADGLR